MARQSVTENQVFEAADQLQQEGLAISCNAIRDKVGIGSYSTIITLLDKWREAKLVPEMPDTLNRSMQQLWAIACKEAQDIVKGEHEALATTRLKIELEYQNMVNEISQLETKNLKLEDDLYEANKIEKKLSIENTKLYELVEDAMTRVDDIFIELEVSKFAFPPNINNELSSQRGEAGVIYMDEKGECPIGYSPSKLMQLKLDNGAKRMELLKSTAARQESSSSQKR